MNLNDKTAPLRPDVRAESIAFLTGQLSSEPWPNGISLPGGGGKFSTDGSVQSWPGNTFICHVDPQSDVHNELRSLQEQFKMSRFAQFFTFLPPSSFHMTVFEGVSPGVKDTERLPLGATDSMSRDALTNIMLKAVEDVRFATTQTVEMDSLFCGLGLRVIRVGEQGETPLRINRNTLRTATGINPPDFDTYTFHITFAYLVQWLTEPTAIALVDLSEELAGRYKEKLSAIPLGPVEFCNFDTMHHFDSLKRLV